MTQIAKADDRKVLEANNGLYRNIHCCDPYFTLTPEGAAALKTFLEINKIRFSKVGGACGESLGVETYALQQFFNEKAPFLGNLSAENISFLLGAATRGFDSPGTGKGMVALDPKALDAILSRSQRQGR